MCISYPEGNGPPVERTVICFGVKRILVSFSDKGLPPTDLVRLVSQPSPFGRLPILTCGFLFQMDTDIYKLVVTELQLDVGENGEGR